jgi:hypothetical protein
MKNKVIIGLLAVVAIALIVNVYMYSTGGSNGEVNPTGAKATFERTAATAGEAQQNAYDAIAASDPTQNANTSRERAAQLEPAKPTGPLTSLKFDQMAHDFGTIKQDSENLKIFKFTNTGKEPLIIENAKGSCGCTVPEYPKEPIAPGATGEIKVVYRPGKQKDMQTKNVTITANTDPANTVLTISAKVLEVAG